MFVLLPRLEPCDQARLLDDLNYLNVEEYRAFCTRHGIPYRVLVEGPAGRAKATVDADRKPLVLSRIRHYLTTGAVLPPTCLSADVVRPGPPPATLTPDSRLYYRWYNKNYRSVMKQLVSLTDGRFRDGAVARVLIMTYWIRGEAPSFSSFAKAWVHAKTRSHELLTPEYAYLTDLQKKQAGKDWRVVRQYKAARALKVLKGISESDPVSPAPV